MTSEFVGSRVLAAGGKAFLFALVLTPIVRDIFRAYNVVDRPGRRKVHAYPIPRVGGVPITVGYVFALLALSIPNSGMHAAWIRQLMPGLAIIFLTGLIDDFFNLKPVVKLLGEIAAAVAVYAAGLHIHAIGDQALPDWVSLPLTVFWLLLATNAQNLIDGLDGLCAGTGFFATLTFVCAGLLQGNAALVSLSLPLAGALLGFIIYNFNPATVFLGDSGALTIGFLLGCYGLVWTEMSTGGMGTLVPLLAIAIPVTDISLSIVRRSLRGRPIFSADRGHIHHRLLDRGLSVRQSALILYFIAAVATVFAILVSDPAARRFHVVIVAGMFAAAGAGIRQLRYPEFKVASKLIFGGDIRRAFRNHLRLEDLRVALQRAKNEEEWWATLVEAGRLELWVRLTWLGHEPALEAILSERTTDWSFRIAVAEGEVIVVEGAAKPFADATAEQSSLDLIATGEVLRRTLKARRQHSAVL